MAAAPRVAARCCSCAHRTFTSLSIRSTSTTAITKPVHRRRQQPRRWQSTEAASTGAENPKIANIVDQISQLTLLETADLVSTLKSRLNIPDLPVGGFAAGPAPTAAAAAPVEEDEPAPKAEEKTLFNLTLKSFDAAAKPKVIKEIKQLLGLSLVDSKKFVESAPKQMKENASKEECDKIIETLKAVGAEVTMD